MTVKEAGTYRALVTNWGVNDSRNEKRLAKNPNDPNGDIPPFFQAEFEIRQRGTLTTDAEGKQVMLWKKIEGEYPRIIADFYVYKNDGTPSDFTWTNLMTVFQWDGVSLQSLNDTDFSKVKCQIVIEPEEYNGASYMKVKWLNTFDAEPKQKTVRNVKNSASLSKWTSRGGPVVPIQSAQDSGFDDLSMPESSVPF